MEVKYELAIGVALITLGSFAIWKFFKGANYMATEVTKQDDSAAETQAEVFKERETIPSVEELEDVYHADDRTSTGIKAAPGERPKDEDGEDMPPTLDNGVDVNAPRVDPGHMRNAVMKEQGLIKEEKKKEDKAEAKKHDDKSEDDKK